MRRKSAVTGGPRRHWYERFGIEPPFPWLLVAMYAVPVLIVLVGVIAGMTLSR